MVLKIGHRGASGHEPENTLRSFKKALEFGADMVEMDTWVCKTGELVIIHDERLERTTDGEGFVWQKTLEEIKSLDAGRGERVPTFDEALNLVNKQAKVGVELKTPKATEPISHAIENYVENHSWSYEDFLVSSFDSDVLYAFSKINPNIKLDLLVEFLMEDIEELVQKMNLYSVSSFVEAIDKDFIKNIRKKGIKIFSWTADKIEDIKRMKDLGVDGIYSNFPDRLN